jgi:hypothetical protein
MLHQTARIFRITRRAARPSFSTLTGTTRRRQQLTNTRLRSRLVRPTTTTPVHSQRSLLPPPTPLPSLPLQTPPPPSTTYTYLYPLVEPDLSEPNSSLLPDGSQPSSPGPQRWVPTSPIPTASPSVVAARSAADAAPAERNRWNQLLDAQHNEVNQYQQSVQPFIPPGNRRMVLVPSSLEDPQPVSVCMQEGTHEWGWEWGIVGVLSLLFCFRV